MNLDDYKPIRTHWITFYVNDDNVKFFDSIEVEHIQKYIKKVIKIIIKNIYRKQAYNSIMCGCFCTGFL